MLSYDSHVNTSIIIIIIIIIIIVIIIIIIIIAVVLEFDSVLPLLNRHCHLKTKRMI